MPGPEPPREIPGELTGPRYALGEQFSKGGMGGLWYARESATGRTIALKRIPEAVRVSAAEAHAAGGSSGISSSGSRRMRWTAMSR